jgi:hypothetical protein
MYIYIYRKEQKHPPKASINGYKKAKMGGMAGAGAGGGMACPGVGNIEETIMRYIKWWGIVLGKWEQP